MLLRHIEIITYMKYIFVRKGYSHLANMIVILGTQHEKKINLSKAKSNQDILWRHDDFSSYVS
jgi:hypothetical protein